MKTKLKKFGAWLMAAALAFAGAGAYGAVTQVATQGELDAAVKNAAAGDVIEITVAATYKVPSPTSAIKIVGVDGVVFNAIDVNYGQSVGQATGTEFENVKFAFGSSLYTGFQHSSYVAFTKCSFTGRFNSYGEMHFTECSFEAPSSDYSMWLYAGDTYFNDCTFSGNGKFFNVYNEGNTSVPWIVEFDGCTFSSTAKNKAALNVKSTCGSKGLKYDVRVNNCKIDPAGDNFPTASVGDTLIVFNGLIQLDDIKANVPNEITITQDGKVLYADNAVAGPEVAIKEPTKEEVVAKTKGEATGGQKEEKAEEVVAVIAKAAEEETLEVGKSGLSAAGKTADGKLADPLVTALKDAAGEEKKAEITNETKVKKTIDVVFKGMTVEAGDKVTTTKIAYDVTPKATVTLSGDVTVSAKIPNGTFGKINFRMPLTADFAGRWLKVSRTDDGTDFVDVGLYQAQKDGDVDFVQVDGDHFTTYVTEFSNEIPAASINGKGYVTLDAAMKAAVDGDEILLLCDTEWNCADRLQTSGFSVRSASEDPFLVTVKNSIGFDGDRITISNINFKAGSGVGHVINCVSQSGRRMTKFEVSGCKFESSGISGSSICLEGESKVTDCVIIGGSRGIGWSYAWNGGVDIVNCKISGTTYGIHFDGGPAPIRVKNCEIAAWNSYGGISSMTFEGCKFLNGSYNFISAQSDSTFINCEFGSKFDCQPGAPSAWGMVWTFSGCTYDGVAFTESVLKDKITVPAVWEKCLVIIDGDKVRHAAEDLTVKYKVDPTDWLAEGYCAKQGTDGKWTVGGAVAEIVGGRKFMTLAEAIAAVTDGCTVKVLKSGNVVTDYAKQLEDPTYVDADEDAGNNRLVINTEAAFTLDLNGMTLNGRINVTRGQMTVDNGTLTAKTQALNIYGTKDADYTNKVWSAITLNANATVRAAYGFCVFGGDPSSSYYPLGFGEVVDIYGKVFAPSPVFVSGNVGMNNYTDNIVLQPEVEALKTATGMRVSDLMFAYGPKINVYDGAELGASLEGGDEDSPQGISVQGSVTVNIYGGKIVGAEAIGVKGGVLNVMGGELIGAGPKVNPIAAVISGTESSGAGIAVSTSYNGNYPIVVNVTGGTIKSANNAALLIAHSYSGNSPISANEGVSATVVGGTFIGGEGQSAILVEPMLKGEEGKYPAYFITAQVDENGKETGYPLCNSPILAEYIAVGYKEKDNENKTWTVTAVSQEIVIKPEDAKFEEKTYVDDQGQTKTPTDEEKAAADKAVKEIETVYQDQVLTKVEGTGIAGAAVEPPTQPGEQPKLKPSVITALNNSPNKPDDVTFVAEDGSNSWSHLVIKLKSTTTKVVTETATIKTSVNEMKVDVKPVIEVTPIKDGVAQEPFETDMPQEAFPPEGITFPLFVSEAFRGKWALVKHAGDPDYETEVLEDEKNRPFVVITATHFSEFTLLVLETSSKAVKRATDGKLYDTFADAIVDETTAADETFTLLKDTEEVVKLGAKQTIVTDGHAFGGIDPDVLEAGWTEPVNTDGKVFIAPVKVNVPVSDEEGAPVIRVRMRAADVTTPEENVAALKEVKENGRPLWQNMALGVANDFRLIPMIPRSAIGFKTIKICSNLDDAALAAAAKQRDGVAVKFQLLKKVGAGDYVQCGEVQDKPVFTVEADELESRTFWKIQTIFSEEY